MDTDRIKKIKESKRKAAQRKYDNFQASGDNKYYYEYQHYSDLVSICDMALSISDIKSQNTDIIVGLSDVCETARVMYKNGEYYDPEAMKHFLGDLLLFGRKHGVCREV